MAVLQNSWVEKEKKKRTHETSPAYESDSSDSYQYAPKKSVKRHTMALRATLSKTLRGVRK